MFFLKHTAFPVYSIGLDLQPGSGYPHGRPHPFSPETNGRAFRFHPLESQVVQSKLNSALDIYRSWFARLPQALSGRLFRLESSAGELGQLGGIRSLPVRQPDVASPDGHRLALQRQGRVQVRDLREGQQGAALVDPEARGAVGLPADIQGLHPAQQLRVDFVGSQLHLAPDAVGVHDLSHGDELQYHVLSPLRMVVDIL